MICRAFSTRATGLDAATSGVTSAVAVPANQRSCGTKRGEGRQLHKVEPAAPIGGRLGKRTNGPRSAALSAHLEDDVERGLVRYADAPEAGLFEHSGKACRAGLCSEREPDVLRA